MEILNFNKPLNVEILDKLVKCMYEGTPEEVGKSQKLLTTFQNHNSSWIRVNQILQQSKYLHTKYLALQILFNTVKYKWNILSDKQKDGIKSFIVGTILKKSQSEEVLKKEKNIIQKLDEVLVQIAKQEWPMRWRDLIPQICKSSRSNQNVCENNMNIFKLLSEEIFDFSRTDMKQHKIAELKKGFNKEFSNIFELCEFILQNGKKPSLISVTLQTLERFLGWIPLGYIFETNLLQRLLSKFLHVTQFRNDTLGCLIEIASLSTDKKYDQKFENIFKYFMTVLVKILPPSTNIPLAYQNGTAYDQKFIQHLALFFSNFFKNHLKIVEKDQYIQMLSQAHLYIINISRVNDKEVFKACLEYWSFLVHDLYFSEKSVDVNNPLMVGSQSNSRTKFYAPVLSQLRSVMVNKMAKPEEVIIFEDENGEIVKEYYKDVDSIQLYKSMKYVLVYLTHLDKNDMEKIMVTILSKQVENTDSSWHSLNSLCWAIGSISGSMDEGSEKKFLITVIRDLLNLVDDIKEKSNKAVVAANIMYVVGQYPRFLVAHWKFLKTVVNKLFEFMHETFNGVQEMAVETFLKISKRCKRKFVIIHKKEEVPFIGPLLENINEIVCDLAPQHIQIFYEAVGFMISSAASIEQGKWIQKLMNIPNRSWNSIIQIAKNNSDKLRSNDLMRELLNVLKLNVSASSSVGTGFISQIKRIYQDMLGLYNSYSKMISIEVEKNGDKVVRYQNVKLMRAVKREILKLVENFISNSNNNQLIAQNFMPLLLKFVLNDYKSSVPGAKDPQVLSLLSASIDKLKEIMLPNLPKVLESVLENTLPLITKNFEDFPEHRINLFKLIRSMNKNCFQVFQKIPLKGFKLIIDSILWAIKHKERNIFETGLQILDEMMINIEKTNDKQMIMLFYQQYSIKVLIEIFRVLTDTFHKSGFKLQSTIIHRILVAFKFKIKTPIFNQVNKRNEDFVKEKIAINLSEWFKNLSKKEIQVFVVSLFNNLENAQNFKNCLRDFLVQMKEFSRDDSDLFYEEKEKEKEKKILQKQQVPGL